MRYRTAVEFTGLVLACLMLVGCASPYAYYCDDGCGGPYAVSGRHGDVGVAACDGCGPVMPGPVMPGPVVSGPVGCDPPCATPCGGACGGTCAGCAHTLTALLRGIFTCNAGCGDMYWGEWCYDPPAACDPCNDHGDFVGHGCCGPSCWQRFWQGVHGARYCPVGCTTGCSACCDVGCGVEPACGCDDGGMPSETMFEGEVYESVGPEMKQLEAVPAPPPAQPGTVTSVMRRSARPYYNRNPQSRLVRRPSR